MIGLIYAWFALAAVLLTFVVGKGDRSGPLVMAYFFGLSIIHVPGAACYVGAAADSPQEGIVQTGFQVVLIGLACFLGGAFVAQRTVGRRSNVAETRIAPDSRFAWLLITVGVFAYFVALPIASLVPSATSIVSSAGALILVGFWNYFYQAQQRRHQTSFAVGLATLPILPLSTMVSGGFLGFGVYWLIAIGSSIYVTGKRKLLMLALLPVAIFSGLSFAVAYLSDRNVLREQVWYQQATLENRLAAVTGMFARLEPVDFNNPNHTMLITSRMNESRLLGTGIERHKEGNTALLYGATVSISALVPRVLWQNKPDIGGGGDLVSQFTGIQFAAGTSVGAGQPLEFYMNFGMPGIVCGFALWGFILARLDLAIRFALLNLDVRALLRAGLPGIAMLQPGGNLVEVLVSAAASLVLALAAEAVLKEFRVLNQVGRLRGAVQTVQHRLPQSSRVHS